jgi:response regulator RpfG family c-di-GMP phosphodiesterase
MDYMMPEMNGAETIKAIAEEGLDKNCVVLMLTGMTEPPGDLHSLSERVLNYIRKPFSRVELCAQVEEAMSFLPPE